MNSNSTLKSTALDQFLTHFYELLDYIKSNLGNLLWDMLSIIVIFFIAKFILHIISNITSHVMNGDRYHKTDYQGKRLDTLMTLVRSVARYLVYFGAIIMVLNQFNLGKPMNSLLVTAGIGSLAIGFGAQNLVRDVVTGFFMMFENQFSVGDYIKTDEAEGTVEATAMRVTYLRSLKGDQIIVPNGSISRVINYSRGGYFASVTISISYEVDTRSMIDIIDIAVHTYAAENAELIDEEPVVLGITAFRDSYVDINVICKVRPMKQWQVERGMRLAVKEAFDKSGVSFPYPHIVTVPYSKTYRTIKNIKKVEKPLVKSSMPDGADAEMDD